MNRFSHRKIDALAFAALRFAKACESQRPTNRQSEIQLAYYRCWVRFFIEIAKA